MRQPFSVEGAELGMHRPSGSSRQPFFVVTGEPVAHWPFGSITQPFSIVMSPSPVPGMQYPSGSIRQPFLLQRPVTRLQIRVSTLESLWMGRAWAAGAAARTAARTTAETVRRGELFMTFPFERVLRDGLHGRQDTPFGYRVPGIGYKIFTG